MEIVVNVREVAFLLHVMFNLENSKDQRTTSSTKIPHLIIPWRYQLLTKMISEILPQNSSSMEIFLAK